MSDVAFAPAMNTQQLSNAQMASYGSDNSLMVTFYKETILLEHETEVQGKPVYKDFDYVHIVQPGGKSDIKRRVKLDGSGGSPPDPERFPRQWQQFQNKNVEVKDGLPLEQCPFLPKAEVMGFKASGVFTVEQLAGVPDSALHNFGMTGRKYRDMAIAYMDRAEKNKDISALVSENAHLRSEMAALKAQFAEFSAESSAKAEVPGDAKPATGRKQRIKAND
jgi:hypothetical protein